MKVFMAVLLAFTLGYTGFETGRYVERRTAPVIESVEPMQRYEQTPRGVMFIADVAEPAVSVKETQTIGMYLLSNVVPIVAAPIGALIAALLVQILALVAKKYHINVSSDIQQHLFDSAETAVHKAEAWAAKYKDVPSSNDKLNFAIKSMRNVAELPAVKKYTDEQLSHYIEEAVFNVFNKKHDDAAALASK